MAKLRSVFESGFGLVFTLLIVFVFDPLAIAMVIALNKLLGRKDDNGTDNIIHDGNGGVTPDSDYHEPIVEEDEEEPSEPQQEEVQEVLEESQPENQVRTFDDNEQVRFVPNEDAKELYGENVPPVIKKIPSTNITKGTTKTAAWRNL